MQGARRSPEPSFAGRKWVVTKNSSYYIAQVEDYLARRGAAAEMLTVATVKNKFGWWHFAVSSTQEGGS